MLSDTHELVEMQSLRLSQDQSVMLEALAAACDHSSSIHVYNVQGLLEECASSVSYALWTMPGLRCA